MRWQLVAVLVAALAFGALAVRDLMVRYREESYGSTDGARMLAKAVRAAGLKHPRLRDASWLGDLVGRNEVSQLEALAVLKLGGTVNGWFDLLRAGVDHGVALTVADYCTCLAGTPTEWVIAYRRSQGEEMQRVTVSQS